MKILYSGHYSAGSTSRMRGEYLSELLAPEKMIIADTDESFRKTNRIFRTIGWRYKIGPLISGINNRLEGALASESKYDIAWIDKGVFIRPELVERIRSKCQILIHYTPDPAFLFHKSTFFDKSIQLYDYLITTKSFELDYYRDRGAKNIIFSTQGFDPKMHKPSHEFHQKTGISFLGHREDNREVFLTKILEKKLPLVLAGRGWKKFAFRHRTNKYLQFLGEGVYGTAYAYTISGTLMSIGFLSKWIPELHTTRTFEIPACRTALLTERNGEIRSFLKEDEAVFYDDEYEFIAKIEMYFKKLTDLEKVTESGYNRIISGGYDYKTIMKTILNKAGICEK